MRDEGVGAVGDVGGVDGAGGTTRPAAVPAAARGVSACRRGARQAHSRSPAGVTNLRLQCQRHKGFLGRVGCPCRVATQRQGVPLHPPGFAAVEGIDGLPVAGLQRGPLAAVDGARSTGGGGRGKVHRQRVAPGRGPGHEGHHRWGGLCAAEFALLTQGLCHALERQPHKVPTGLSARCAVCSLDEASDRLALVGRRGLRTVRSIRSRLSPFS